MKLATPRAWYQREPPAPVLRALLTPPAWLWAEATRRRWTAAKAARVKAPVICVGNLTLGGSGKTPVAREIARRLRGLGRAPHLLLRGHGGRHKGPTRVDPDRHAASDVGDEALMLAAETPTWVARDRVAGAAAAIAAGADVIVMDDGHQNGSLAKDLSFVVVDGETRGGEWPFGAGAVFPAGPMREPLARGLSRADAVIVLLPADLDRPAPELIGLFTGKPLLLARLEATASPPPGPQLAFAGIAKPWRMEHALTAAGCDLADFAPFADHAELSEATMRFLSRRAAALGAGLLTSEKDWARLPGRWRERVAVFAVAARFEDEAALESLLRVALAGPTSAEA